MMVMPRCAAFRHYFLLLTPFRRHIAPCLMMMLMLITRFLFFAADAGLKPVVTLFSPRHFHAIIIFIADAIRFSLH